MERWWLCLLELLRSFWRKPVHQPIMEVGVTPLPKFNIVEATDAPSLEGWTWDYGYSSYKSSGSVVDSYGFSESAHLNSGLFRPSPDSLDLRRDRAEYGTTSRRRRKWRTLGRANDHLVVRRKTDTIITCLVDDCPDCFGSGYDAVRNRFCTHPEVPTCLCPKCAPNFRLFKDRESEDENREIIPWEGD